MRRNYWEIGVTADMGFTKWSFTGPTVDVPAGASETGSGPVTVARAGPGPNLGEPGIPLSESAIPIGGGPNDHAADGVPSSLSDSFPLLVEAAASGPEDIEAFQDTRGEADRETGNSLGSKGHESLSATLELAAEPAGEFEFTFGENLIQPAQDAVAGGSRGAVDTGSIMAYSTLIAMPAPEEATAAPEKTFYIDPSAQTAADGSIEHPFNSWSQVTWTAGAAYLQKEGTTYSGSIVVDHVGSSSAHTTIGAYGGDTPPKIIGSVVFDGSSNVSLSGFEITGSKYAGVAVTNGSHHIGIEGNQIHANAAGVWFSTDSGGSNTVHANHVFNNVGNGISFDTTDGQAGSETIVSENRVEFNGVHGIDVYANHVNVIDNIVFSNGGTTPGASGIHVHSWDPAENMGQNNYIAGNVTYGNLDAGGNDGIGILLDHYTGHNIVENNLSFSNDGQGIGVYASHSNTVRANTVFGNMLDRSETHTLFSEIAVNTNATLGSGLAHDNTVTGNTVLSYWADSFAFLVDAEASRLRNTVGENLLYHAPGSTEAFWGTRGGVDMDTWNSLASGGGDDFSTGLKLASEPVGELEFAFGEDLVLPVDGSVVAIRGWDSEVGLVGDWLY